LVHHSSASIAPTPVVVGARGIAEDVPVEECDGLVWWRSGVRSQESRVRRQESGDKSLDLLGILLRKSKGRGAIASAIAPAEE
jgi:hypothetical protein